MAELCSFSKPKEDAFLSEEEVRISTATAVAPPPVKNTNQTSTFVILWLLFSTAM